MPKHYRVAWSFAQITTRFVINWADHEFQSRDSCYVGEETPGSSITEPFTISSSMMLSIPTIFRLLPIGACRFSIDTTNEKPIEFSLSGTQVTLGDRRWQIASNSEAVFTFNYAFNAQFTAPCTDPGFLLSTENSGTDISLGFTRNREITRFSAADGNGSLVMCSFDWRGMSL